MPKRTYEIGGVPKRMRTVTGYNRSKGGYTKYSRMRRFVGAKPHANIKGAIAPYGGRKELKYTDLASATYAADTTGTVTCLNLIAVGDDNVNRDGRQVTMKSIQLHGFVAPNSDQTSATKVRLLLVWDNAVNSGAIATIAQILTAANAEAFPLVDNANRFTILVDRSYVVGRVSNTATQSFAMSNTICDVEVYKKLNAVTQFSGTTAAIGSIQNGGLLMVTIGDIAAGTTAASFKIATRARWTDE